MLKLNSLLGATALISFLGLISRLVGLYRDRILAATFGPSDILDVYYVSFGLPDLIFNLLIVGSLASAFIPKFIEYKTESEKKAFELANNFLNIALVAISLLALLVFIFAESFIALVGPGFEGAKKDLAVLFIRVMVLSPVLFTISVIAGSILQSYKRFLAYSLAPVMYNLGIIIGALWLVPLFGPLGLAEGVVLGALLHLLTQLPALMKTGYSWSFIFNIRDKGFKEIAYLMLPRSFGLAVGQVNWIFVNAMATTMFAGGTSILNLAHNLQYLPIALVGISLAVASFPDMSRYGIAEDRSKLWRMVNKNISITFLIVIPASFVLYFFSDFIVGLILRVGQFGVGDAAATARAVRFFALGIPAASIIPTLARAFYAMKNSRIPVISGIAGVVINILFILSFRSTLGLFSLPLGLALASISNALSLWIMLKIKINKI